MHCLVYYILVSLLFPFAATAIINPIDFLALQSIRKNLEDMPGSTFFSTWDFTADPCDFSGVFCVADRVVALTLGDPAAGSPGLIGRLDPAVSSLTDLTEFTLVPGRVVGPIPNTISKLTNLRFLALSRNFLSGSIPSSLVLLPNLHTLDLSFNSLSGAVPYTLSLLPSLTNLILSHNQLSGPVPPFYCPNLSRLDLKNNLLSGTLRSLPRSLTYLSLSANNLSGEVGPTVSRLINLNYLDLSSNSFSGTIPPELFSFPLRTLQLDRNRLTGPVLLQSGTPSDIDTVDLSYNRLSGMISPGFASVKNLYLNNNEFSGEVPGSFVDRLLESDIQVLYLQHNFLTGIQISPAAEIPMRTSLCLQYNCMVPPVQTPCPLKAGGQKTRPLEQCTQWKG